MSSKPRPPLHQSSRKPPPPPSTVQGDLPVERDSTAVLSAGVCGKDSWTLAMSTKFSAVDWENSSRVFASSLQKTKTPSQVLSLLLPITASRDGQSATSTHCDEYRRKRRVNQQTRTIENEKQELADSCKQVTSANTVTRTCPNSQTFQISQGRRTQWNPNVELWTFLHSEQNHPIWKFLVSDYGKLTFPAEEESNKTTDDRLYAQKQQNQGLLNAIATSLNHRNHTTEHDAFTLWRSAQRIWFQGFTFQKPGMLVFCRSVITSPGLKCNSPCFLPLLFVCTTAMS